MGSHLQPHAALGGREQWSEPALPTKGGQRHHGATPGPAASKQLRGLGILLAQGPSAPDPHVRPEAPVTGVWPCRYGDACLKQWERLRVRGYVCCRHGGANGSAGTSGIPEYRQGCSADAALRPSPALVQQCQAEALAHGEPMARASCIQGACTGEANQFCKLFQQALLGQPRFTVMVLWSGHISVKPHMLQGCISFSFAFPSCGGVGGCVHFLLVLLVVHLPGTKKP